MMRHLSKTLLLALVMLFGVVTFAQNNATVSGGDDAQLREFIARYLGGYGNETVEILIGSLPEDFPLILPEGARPLATILRDNVGMRPRDEGGTIFVEIMLADSPMPEQVYAFYQASAENNGWQEIDSVYTPPSGFNANSNAYGSYCTADGSLHFTYDSYSPDGQTVVSSLRYESPAEAFMCNQAPYPPYQDPMRLIPALTLPADTTIDNQLGGTAYYGEATIAISASLTSGLSLEALNEHYSTDLSNAGWQQSAQDAGSASITSQWLLSDEEGKPYVGMMVITQSPDDATRYRALILLEPQTNS